MTLVGVSTAVLARRVDLSPLLDLRPDIVEWYALPSSVVGEIERFGAYGIQSALHAPMPFEGPGTPRFAPTSVDSDLAAAALTMVRRTLECARSLGALYVVIHFPDPDPPYAPAGFSDRAAAFLDEVIELSSRSSIPVLLENMTPNPCLRSPAQYESVLARYPELGLCLDLGHAHLTQPSHTLDAYIDALAGRVRAVHVYNTTPARYAQHGHEPIAERQATDDGNALRDRIAADGDLVERRLAADPA